MATEFAEKVHAEFASRNMEQFAKGNEFFTFVIRKFNIIEKVRSNTLKGFFRPRLEPINGTAVDKRWKLSKIGCPIRFQRKNKQDAIKIPVDNLS